MPLNDRHREAQKKPQDAPTARRVHGAHNRCPSAHGGPAPTVRDSPGISLAPKDRGIMLESLSKSVTRAPVAATRYRYDIEGLRALAVIAVVTYHARLPNPGGFVGVDVFFVISGYLITKIIETELRRGRFGVMAFYQRRIRRIFPALLAMLAGCLALAWVVLLPEELVSFGKSLMASAAFVSNVLFRNQIGYFDAASEEKPLLHAWSLSVEEQFYIFWPIILVAATRMSGPRGRIVLCGMIFCLSLLFSDYRVHVAPAAAFYLLPARAWELALGALLALTIEFRARYRLPRPAADLASLVGIALITYAIFAFDSKMPFPGVAALVPCIGAGLVIAAGEGQPTLGGRLLSVPPLTFIGRISYSLYLWHWPILVFAAIYLERALRIDEACWALVVAFMTAGLSWRFVERPFRELPVSRANARSWIGGGIAAGIAAVCAGALFVRYDGFPGRVPSMMHEIATVKAEAEAFQMSPCLARGAEVPPVEGCLLGLASKGGVDDVILWGDSHAAQLAPLLDALGRRLRFTAREITKAGCPPLAGVTYFHPAHEVRLRCSEFNAAVMETILRHEPGIVVLAGWWIGLATGQMLVSDSPEPPTVAESRRTFIALLTAMARKLTQAGHRIVIIGQVPVPKSNPVSCIERRLIAGRPASECAAPAAPWVDASAFITEQLRTAVEGLPDVQLVVPVARLCDTHVCRILTEQGELTYFDAVHLSAAGTRALDADLRPALVAARRPRAPVPY